MGRVDCDGEDTDCNQDPTTIWILWAGWKESSYSDPFLLQDIDITRRMVRIGRMVKLT